MLGYLLFVGPAALISFHHFSLLFGLHCRSPINLKRVFLNLPHLCYLLMILNFSKHFFFLVVGVVKKAFLTSKEKNTNKNKQPRPKKWKNPRGQCTPYNKHKSTHRFTTKQGPHLKSKSLGSHWLNSPWSICELGLMISHGSPTLGFFWERPKSILVIPGHWDTPEPAVSLINGPKDVIYDATISTLWTANVSKFYDTWYYLITCLGYKCMILDSLVVVHTKMRRYFLYFLLSIEWAFFFISKGFDNYILWLKFKKCH